MTRSLIFGSLAGAASALLVLTAASGPLGFLLGYLAPLPLFFAGLTHGVPAVAMAGAVGAGISALNGLLAGGVYAVTFAAPVALVVRQALLARPATEAGPEAGIGGAEISGDLEWYPAGRLVAWLTGWALGLLALAVLATADVEGGLTGALEPLLTQFLAAMPPEALGAQGQGLGAEGTDMAAVARRLAMLMPAVFGVSWLVMMIVNGTLAQGLAGMIKQNRRPSPQYRALTLPRFLVISLAAASVAGVALPDQAGFIALTVAAILIVPYFMQGLAVVHVMAAKAAASGLILAAFYAALVVAGALVGGLVLILGLIEEWAGFRRRLAGAGTSRENE